MEDRNAIYAQALQAAVEAVQADLGPDKDLAAELRARGQFLMDVAAMLDMITGKVGGPQANDPIEPFPGQLVYRPVFSPFNYAHTPEWVKRLAAQGELPKNDGREPSNKSRSFWSPNES